MKSIVLLSGGMDSAVCLARAVKETDVLETLSFWYSQRSQKELYCAKKLSEHYKVRNRLLTLNGVFGHSPLTNTDAELPEESEGIAPTFVPGRNIVFLSIAASRAYELNARVIYIGVNSKDYSGYPDCRDAFIQSMNDAVQRGLEWNSVICAPLQFMRKSDIVKEGVRLKVPFEYTWSCYSESESACGKCESCILRLKAFKENGIVDPIEYKEEK